MLLFVRAGWDLCVISSGMCATRQEGGKAHPSLAHPSLAHLPPNMSSAALVPEQAGCTLSCLVFHCAHL